MFSLPQGIFIISMSWLFYCVIFLCNVLFLIMALNHITVTLLSWPNICTKTAELGHVTEVYLGIKKSNISFWCLTVFMSNRKKTLKQKWLKPHHICLSWQWMILFRWISHENFENLQFAVYRCHSNKMILWWRNEMAGGILWKQKYFRQSYKVIPVRAKKKLGGSEKCPRDKTLEIVYPILLLEQSTIPLRSTVYDLCVVNCCLWSQFIAKIFIIERKAVWWAITVIPWWK